MRFILKVSFPVEAGNAAIRDGSLGRKVQSILEDAKPEAVYFTSDGGTRGAFIVVNMDDASQLPALAEPWFLAFDAKVERLPVMTLEDLEKAGPSIGNAVKKYG